MSPSQLIFSEELEGILRDVAKDPESILLRAPRKKSTAKLFSALGPPGPMAGGLSAAERELMRSHRDELAALLRDACWAAAQEVGRKLACLDRRDGLGHVQKPHSIAQLRSRARGALSTSGESTISVLERLVSTDAARRPTVAELAAVSHKIQPSDHSRTCAALDLIWRDLPNESLGFSLEVAHHGTLLANRIAGWRNAGVAWEMIGQFNQALTAVRAAIDLEAGYTYSALQEYFLLLQSGNRLESIRTARVVSESMEASDPHLLAFAADLRARRLAGRWTPTNASRSLVAEFRRTEAAAPQKVLASFD